MRIIYTLGLLIGVPLAVLLVLWLVTTFNDFIESKFGKPPAWVGAICAAVWICILVKAAWDKAGEWVK